MTAEHSTGGHFRWQSALIPTWIDDGVTIWQPAQVMNDLREIQKKYGPDFVLNGCWDTSGIASYASTTEDMIRQLVRDTIDTYAVNGGFVFWDGGAVGDDLGLIQKLGWAQDEAQKYGKVFYKKDRQII